MRRRMPKENRAAEFMESGELMAGITIKKIAELAGVSIGTVDRVLHDRGEVNQETRKRIQEICQAYGYRSNVIGKAMVMQRNENIVAVIINRGSLNTFNRLVHDGLQEIAREIKDYNIVFKYFDVQDNAEEEILNILDSLSETKLAGIIIRMVNNQKVIDRLNWFHSEKKVPVVTCTTDAEGIQKLCFVGQNHYKQGRLLANTLCKITQEDLKILVVVGPLKSASRKQKLNGFLDYMKEQPRPYTILDIAEAKNSEEAVYRCLKSQMDRFPDANAWYLHPMDIRCGLQFIKEYGKGGKRVFTYGAGETLRQMILDGILDFAIYEEPFQHGYLAGKTLFEYLMNGTVPKDNRLIFEGKIVFEENC